MRFGPATISMMMRIATSSQPPIPRMSIPRNPIFCAPLVYHKRTQQPTEAQRSFSALFAVWKFSEDQGIRQFPLHVAAVMMQSRFEYIARAFGDGGTAAVERVAANLDTCRVQNVEREAGNPSHRFGHIPLPDKAGAQPVPDLESGH